jgi:hypothetical protein
VIWDHVQLTPDGDRYNTQQCKNDGCERFFKVGFGKGSSNRPIEYCPYCGWEGGQFWTVDQMTYLDCMARNMIKVPNHTCQEPVENGPNIKVTTKCRYLHTELIKHDGLTNQFYCIICGERARIEKPKQAKRAKTAKRGKKSKK